MGVSSGMSWRIQSRARSTCRRHVPRATDFGTGCDSRYLCPGRLHAGVLPELAQGAMRRETELARGQYQAQVVAGGGLLVVPGHAVLELGVPVVVKDALHALEALAHVLDGVKGGEAPHHIDVVRRPRLRVGPVVVLRMHLVVHALVALDAARGHAAAHKPHAGGLERGVDGFLECVVQGKSEKPEEVNVGAFEVSVLARVTVIELVRRALRGDKLDRRRCLGRRRVRAKGIVGAKTRAKVLRLKQGIELVS